MRGRWFYWLAAELAAILLLAGCAGFGDDAPADTSEAHPPIVVVVFDEFPADDLLGPDGQIDAERFPNFAELASMSTWFPNAHTQYDSTFKAVPSILDGREPARGTAPDVRSHKPSVFHLVNRLGYKVFKVESASAVCPPDICPGARTRRPGVLKRLAGGGRPARFHRWIGAIRDRPEPTFYFHHALMPHEPWIYLPSGHQSRPAGNDPVEGINKLPGFDDPDLSVHNHLRHLLQVGYTDHQIGELLGAPPANRGAAPRSRDRDGRPRLFLPGGCAQPAPAQREQRRGDRAGAVLREGAGTDRGTGRREPRAQHRRGGDDRGPARQLGLLQRRTGTRRSRDATRARRSSGSGRATSLRKSASTSLRWSAAGRSGGGAGHGCSAPASRAASSTATRGRWPTGSAPIRSCSAGECQRSPFIVSTDVSAVIANASLVEHVDPHDTLLPTRVTGRLRGVPFDEHRDLAVAVNGRIEAVGRSFDLWFKGREFFSLLVPERSLRSGRNEVDVFEVLSDGGLRPLTPD